ncbi:hypothetical protein [uncultured Tenacibaculum sp.]|uniref:hypothetical protein n=1 Tax=uncultured Tenacibaculum sp. TaxID=174713 RepID=UPI002601CFA4|nr:hypothetical protein [uncultured Tenacibaculum sp.]
MVWKVNGKKKNIMTIKKTLFLICIIMLINCKKKQEKNNLITNHTKSTSKSIQIKKVDTLDLNALVGLYSKSKVSDTIIPFTVYKTSKSETLSTEDYGFYESYDVNKKKYEATLLKMFNLDKNLNDILIKIEQNITKVRKFNREIVSDDYEEYNSLEGESFAYLCNVKDDFALKMADKIFENEKANKEELNRIADWILESFQDSTYVKKIK